MLYQGPIAAITNAKPKAGLGFFYDLKPPNPETGEIAPFGVRNSAIVTTTGPRKPIAEMATVDFLFIPADAATQPVVPRNPLYNGPAPK